MVYGYTLGQVKKPVIMIVPSNAWCKSKNYWTEYNNQGTIEGIPDYTKAFEDIESNVNGVIVKLEKIMIARGFTMINLNSKLDAIKKQTAEDNMTSSSTSSSKMAENPLDKIRNTAKADIIMYLEWKVNNIGGKKSVTFTISAIDSYTDQPTGAGATGTGPQDFSSEVPELLEQAVLSYIDDFNTLLQVYFQDILDNGRKITLRVKTWEDATVNFETEYEGKELREIIDNWIASNTVNKSYSTGNASENMNVFESVRIPTLTENGKGNDATQFATKLKKFLNAPPYNIVCKLIPQGQGKATLVLGAK